MATPTATATVNKPTPYAVGETITLTIDHTDADRAVITLAGIVRDASGNTGTWSVDVPIDKGDVEFTSTGGKVWTLQSATRDRSVFTATA